jgi:hypothetical protein
MPGLIGWHHRAAADEKEAFERVFSGLSQAIQECRSIASRPESGPQFLSMMQNLQNVETALRQIAGYREDSRYLPTIACLAHTQKIARRWLDPATVHTKLKFTLLADALGAALGTLYVLKDARTNKIGAILPAALPHTRTEGRQVQVMRPSGSIIH